MFQSGLAFALLVLIKGGFSAWCASQNSWIDAKSAPQPTHSGQF